ncbi:hypothetical protein PybrP1_001555 [[Pythium] brassicae (nom. inval.)]|nr:hypothetical protein PybrP1_001555 [[Pythium] brassicae (nom. inval.)]
MELHVPDENVPAARPTAPALALTDVAGAPAAAEQTVALVATCSGMLLLALALHACGRHVRGRRASASVPPSRLPQALDVGALVVLWYAISIGMTLFNKWFLRVFAGGGFPFATTMTCANMFVKCVLSRAVHACSRRRAAPMALSARAYWRLAVPIGLCTALDITLSNLSFFYITVTFYTIVKSGGNVWNLLFSVCLGHQRPSVALFGVILLISSGIALASYGAAQFVWRGFALVLAASVIGTLRWVLTQSLLAAMANDDDATAPAAAANRVLAVVYFISPASALGLLPIAAASEGPQLLASKFVRDPHLLAASAGFVFVSGCLAFVLIFVEILLVNKTSALSLGIAGSLKDVTQVVLAVLVFGDRLQPLNVVGLVVATSGMLLYTHLKHASASASETAAGVEMTAKYARVPTAPQPEDEDAGRDTNNNSDQHEIVVINLDDPSVKKASKAVGSSKREDALVRRESKEFHHDHETRTTA